MVFEIIFSFVYLIELVFENKACSFSTWRGISDGAVTIEAKTTLSRRWLLSPRNGHHSQILWLVITPD